MICRNIQAVLGYRNFDLVTIHFKLTTQPKKEKKDGRKKYIYLRR